MHIQCQPPVIFVKDIAASRQFYEGLLQQKVAMDMGLNLSFAGGFALWQVDHAHQMLFNAPVSDTSPWDAETSSSALRRIIWMPCARD